jgi:hypothetical protein
MNRTCIRTAARIASSLAVTALSLASAACSSVTGDAGRDAVAPVGPVGAAACHATGPAKVLARKVFVPGGVEAVAQESGFSVRFATAASRCSEVGWSHGPGATQPASCPAPGARSEARADADGETMLAWESNDEPEPRIHLGVVTYDAPHAFFGVGIEGQKKIVERTFFAPGPRHDAGQSAPALAPIGRDRFLLAWVDGNVESHELRAQSVVGWGDPLGPSMVLSPKDASVIGRPSVAIAPTGYGLVTYVASLDGEFDVLATPVACAMN